MVYLCFIGAVHCTLWRRIWWRVCGCSKSRG